MVLAVAAYLIAGLLLLVLAALAVCLWSPLSFEASAALETAPGPAAAGDALDAMDHYLMSVVLPVLDDGARASTPGMRQPGPAEPPAARASSRWRVRWIGGAITADEKGVRVFGRRLRGKPASGPGGPGAPDAAGAPGAPGAPEPRGGLQRAGRPGERTKPRTRRAKRAAKRGLRLDLATLRRLWPQVRRALAHSWSRLHLRGRLHVTLGLDDPATLGMLAGMAGALRGQPLVATSWGNGSGFDLRLTPVFGRECLAAQLDLAGRTSAGALLWPWVKLALSRDGRKIWWPRQRTRPPETNKRGGRGNGVPRHAGAADLGV